MPVNPVPEGHHTVTPYLVVPDAAKLIDFVKQAFGATELIRMQGPGGIIVHAQVKIGDSMVMMGAAHGHPAMPAMLYLYLPDVDATYRQALGAGATSAQEPRDEFYGDRVAAVTDASGNKWYLATHKEDVSKEEMDRRMRELMQKRPPAAP